METKNVILEMKASELKDVNGGWFWPWLVGGLVYDIVSNWNESVDSFNKGYLEGFNNEQ